MKNKIMLFNELDYYGYRNFLKTSLNLPIAPITSASMLHGWIPWSDATKDELSHHEAKIRLWHTESQAKYMKSIEPLSEHYAVGLPFIQFCKHYKSNTVDLEQIKDSLLIVMPHSTPRTQIDTDDFLHEFISNTIDSSTRKFRQIGIILAKPDYNNIKLRAVFSEKFPKIKIECGAAVDDSSSFPRLFEVLRRYTHLSSCVFSSMILYAAYLRLKVNIDKKFLYQYSIETFTKESDHSNNALLPQKMFYRKSFENLNIHLPGLAVDNSLDEWLGYEYFSARDEFFAASPEEIARLLKWGQSSTYLFDTTAYFLSRLKNKISDKLIN
ncbi:hypothetical protein G6666_04960 [Polynucleobacter paneuropaeus]|nr:hypothetical protein [Polynucleobacter paneuropaeus]MBT8533712.1 hypothetical protein [Polynucleobacter paneuropaeus]